MDNIKKEISRRNLFRYLGASVLYLPFMRTLMETQAFGAVDRKRAVFFYYPDGNIASDFFPTATGSTFTFPKSTSPLQAVKNDIIMLNNLSFNINPGKMMNHTGGCNHALTGCNFDNIANVSIDTYLGQKLTAKLPVLRLGVSSFAVGRDTMYSAISLSSAMGGRVAGVSTLEDNPTKVFASLFGGGSQGLSAKSKMSLLDTNLEQIKGLQNKLGSIEKEKLDDHIASIRELERRIQSDVGAEATSMAQCSKSVSSVKNYELEFARASENFDVIADLQIELATQALACGVTNVAYIQLTQCVSRLRTTMGKATKGGDTVHTQSHYPTVKAENGGREAFSLAVQLFMKKYAKLVKGMSDVKEGDKSLLYNSSVMAFTEIADGNNHTFDRMGVVLAGQGGGYFKTGRALDVKGWTQNNVLVSVLQSMGLPDTKFGNVDNGKGPIPTLKS